MANLKNTNINDTGHLNLPAGNVTGNGVIRYSATEGKLQVFNTQTAGGTWGDATQPYLTRQIITTGYIHGGYASSVVWSRTNKSEFATDTTIDLGNTQEGAHNYKASMWDNTTNYTFGGLANAHCASNNTITAFNMRTEISYTSGYTRSMPWSTNNPACFQHEHYRGWFTGGGSAATYEMDFSTATLSNLGVNSGTSGGSWGISHEKYSIYMPANQGFMHSTKNYYSRTGSNPQGDKHQHCGQFKHAYHIGGRENNPSSNWRETNMLTDVTADAIGAKPAYSGEENSIVGQDWFYGIGWYQGSHVNTAFKFVYATRQSTSGYSSLAAKGVNGQSSATMSWRD